MVHDVKIRIVDHIFKNVIICFSYFRFVMSTMSWTCPSNVVATDYVIVMIRFRD